MSICLTHQPQTFSRWADPLERLLQYVTARNFEGYDLFDGLNSRLFRYTPFYKSRLCRLALLQFCKQSPINFRPLLLTPKSFDSKGGALFLLGMLHLLQLNWPGVTEQNVHHLFQRIRRKVLYRPHGMGWGYNWDWQARAFFVSKQTPNLISSIFVAQAFLKYYDAFHSQEALDLAMGVRTFILREMIAFETESLACFTYVPGQDTEVHNANLLAAAYLVETLSYDTSENFSELIRKAVQFSLADMRQNGAWPYGTKPFHRWVDNFHTAYNLDALLRIQERFNWEFLEDPLEKTLDYYLDHLFTPEGIPKYYNTSLYPIDIHVIASVILLFNQHRDWLTKRHPRRMQQIESRIGELALLFQDKAGYFYYQRSRYGWNQIPYIRWGQAWMFYALSTLLHRHALEEDR